MIYVPLLLFCVVFFELFVRLRIGSDATAIIARSRESMRVLRSPDLGDDEKERLVRQASVDTSKATARFAAKFFGIGAILYVLFELTVLLLPDLERPLVDGLVSPIVIATLTAATALYAWTRTKIAVRLKK